MIVNDRQQSSKSEFRDKSYVQNTKVCHAQDRHCSSPEHGSGAQFGASKIAIRKAKHTGPVVHGLEVGSGLGPEPKYLSVQFLDTSGPR